MQKLSLAYIRHLTDDFGIWQHTKGNDIDRTHGYALDDSARALILVLHENVPRLAKTYLSFIEKACCDFEQPVNFFSPARKPVDRPMSPDALGETYWALALCVVSNFETARAQRVMEKILPYLRQTDSPRAIAYTLVGAAKVDMALARECAAKLSTQYNLLALPDWPWIENILAYANAIFPLAFIEAGQALNDEKLTKEGLSMLNFLNTVCVHEGKPIAIGNEGWHVVGGEKALYSQQPIDPAYQVLANMAAFRFCGDLQYKAAAEFYFSWFWGNNIAGESLIELRRQCCDDGIDRLGVSANAGAESTICYLLAQHALEA